MKTRTYLPLILMSCLLVTCTVDNPGYSSFYYTALFLGETSFTFEAQMINVAPDYPMPPPEPFEQVFARLEHRYWESYPDEAWETPKVTIVNNKFQMTIGLTANGVTLNEALLSNKENNFLAPLHFPNDFPAVELIFWDSRNEGAYAFGHPLFQTRRKYPTKNNEYDYADCYYIYVAKPIDLSKYEQKEGQGAFGYTIFTHDYDLNFSKPGWYKVVAASRKKYTESELSSTTNNVFRINYY